jgi:hypothetical protein
MAAPHIVAARRGQAMESAALTLREMSQKLGVPFTEPNTHISYGRDFNDLLRVEALAAQLQVINGVIRRKKGEKDEHGRSGGHPVGKVEAAAERQLQP